jgi:hypothetical protein
MRFDGCVIGDISESILTGQVSVKNLNYIIDLTNQIYKDIYHIDFGLYLKENSNKMYVLDCKSPQIWMQGRSEWKSEDKSGIYFWLRYVMYEIIKLIELNLSENKVVNIKWQLWQNQLQFLSLWLDRPAEEYKELRKRLEY